MMKNILGCFVLAAAPAFAGSGYIDGHTLNNRLKDYDVPNKTAAQAVTGGNAQGYITGVADALDGVLFCIPNDVKVGQLIAMTERYLRDNPDKWNRNADTLIVESLRPSFPCAKK
jgi:hypothetical protein